MIIYNLVSHTRMIYTLEREDTGEQVKYSYNELKSLMKSLKIGVRNLYLSESDKLETRNIDCKYTKYISIMDVVDYDRTHRLIAFDTESREIKKLSLFEVFEKANAGEINPDCLIDEFDLLGESSFTNIPYTNYKYIDECDKFISNFNSLIRGLSLDNNLIREAEQSYKKYIHDKLDVIHTKKSDMGVIFDATDWLLDNNYISSKKLFNLGIDNNKIFDSSNNTLDMGIRDPENKVLFSYNPYKSRFEVVVYSEYAESNFLAIKKIIELSIIELFKQFTIKFNQNISNILDNIYEQVDKTNHAQDILDTELISWINNKFNNYIDYSKFESISDMAFHYHTKYPLNKLEELIELYNSKIDLLRLGNKAIPKFLFRIENNKVILIMVESTATNINITIPDWVWSLDNSLTLSDNIKSISVRFSRPLVNSEIFSGCEDLKSVKLYNADIHLSGTRGLFRSCDSLEEVYFDEVFNLQDSEDTRYMFALCPMLEFKNIHSVNPFKISKKCRNVFNMFYGCNKLGKVDTSGWEFDSVDNAGAIGITLN